MTLYKLAVRHAQMMLFALMVTIFFVITFEQIFGFTTPAFALSIVLLVIANARMLQFTCPRCNKNIFFRGWVALPWPERVCSKCDLDLTAEGHG